MPRGAREWRDSPTAHYRHGTVGIGPSDATLTRTTWWTVPASATSFSNWLRAHAPHRLTADSDGGSVEAGGIWEDDQAFRASGSMTHTPAWVNFAFMRYGAGLVVRVDTFVGARFARTTLVPADTNSVTIRHTVRHLGPHARPHTTTRTVTGPAAVARLVGMVDHLPGAMTVPFVASCPGALVEESYRMTFAGPHGSYVAALPSTACWPRLVLLRDGLRSSPPLDPGRVFARTADRYLAQFANSS
ncbi:hypothetical protein [Nocardioides terrisoli]|uniref:hypothetical protein n=1 Tax=Nocardioides terrisoli TaxID=3388267 RepID=UPI00287BAF02|nr:hypothetical protein [Nocardioides marmorisolisilvae]